MYILFKRIFYYSITRTLISWPGQLSFEPLVIYFLVRYFWIQTQAPWIFRQMLYQLSSLATGDKTWLTTTTTNFVFDRNIIWDTRIHELIVKKSTLQYFSIANSVKQNLCMRTHLKDTDGQNFPFQRLQWNRSSCWLKQLPQTYHTHLLLFEKPRQERFLHQLNK